MGFSDNDKKVIRELSKKIMEIASLPVQEKKREMWRKLNGLEDVRPMVWIDEIPWGEFENSEEELHLRCTDKFARDVETEMRRLIYMWNHFRTDAVVDPFWYSPYAYNDSGFGLEIQSKKADSEIGFGSAQYLPLINNEADIEKIKMPVITPDWEKTERDYEMMCELTDGAIPLVKCGIRTMWVAPWDLLVMWLGVDQFFMMLIDHPEFLHKAISRLMDAFLSKLDQLEKHGLLSVSNGNHRVGSGGPGITDELPQKDYDGKHARPIDQWGMSTGQIFSEISPEMHDEFCLQYEMRWLERFGLNYYGCCEPLHNKIDILRKVPRLRRISMSPWADIAKGAEQIGRDYVISHKPNPAILAWDEWNPEQARNELRKALEKAKGCNVEIVMKDISTCRNDPRRISDWCKIAVETAEEFA